MQELPINQEQMAELMKMAGTPAGRKLLHLLQKKQGPQLRKALDTGNFESAKEIVKTFMTDPEARELLNQIRR